jgi:hypothetical protein
VRCEQREPGIVIDFGSDGKPLGIEITAPSVTTLADLNRVLIELSEVPATEQELRPLRAA